MAARPRWGPGGSSTRRRHRPHACRYRSVFRPTPRNAVPLRVAEGRPFVAILACGPRVLDFTESGHYAFSRTTGTVADRRCQDCSDHILLLPEDPSHEISLGKDALPLVDGADGLVADAARQRRNDRHRSGCFRSHAGGSRDPISIPRPLGCDEPASISRHRSRHGEGSRRRYDRPGSPVLADKIHSMPAGGDSGGRSFF